MRHTPTFDALVVAIRARQFERAAGGEAPLEEMHVPAETYRRIYDETLAATDPRGDATGQTRICGVRIRPMS